MINPSTPCPCGSRVPLHHCCGRWFDNGPPAPTAEALMRSRYSAYVLAQHVYLQSTWHLSTRPKKIGGTSLRWIGLHIVRTEQGGEHDSVGLVEFVASYVQSSKGSQLRESSRFVREDGQWFYVDGDSQLSAIHRNTPCPCGSDRKFKRCCGSS